ncbi:MAG: 50S ribosomal protein L17 [Chloroflexi bacterium RBG_16_63_12]|nr:MAG: 50S ribosomal protein L17 [Chloroflexi bacterium RBG_16_63_12]
MGRKLGRSSAQRNALRRTLITQLIEKERIETTEAKAKFVRADAEKLITLAKRGLSARENEPEATATARAVHARRLIAARLNDPEVVKKLFDTIAPRYDKRAGGYTRILKLGRRLGDAAEMVLLEMVEE